MSIFYFSQKSFLKKVTQVTHLLQYCRRVKLKSEKKLPTSDFFDFENKII
jgi:hypothetical protein